MSFCERTHNEHCPKPRIAKKYSYRRAHSKSQFYSPRVSIRNQRHSESNLCFIV